MPDTIREKIISELKTTLEGVTVANGYANDIKSVQRWEQEGNLFVDVPCIVISAGSEQKEDGPIGYLTARMQVDLDLYVRHDKAQNPESTDQLLTSLLGDIEKAVMQDPQRNNNAIDTNITGNVAFETIEGEPHAGLIIELEIQYRHLVADPTQ